MAARRAVFAIMAVALLFGLLFAVITPIWQTPDEPTHTAYIEVLAYQHRLPSVNEEITPAIYHSLKRTGFWQELIRSIQWPGGRTMNISAAGHPPLYYLLCALIFLILTPFGLMGQVLGIRVFGVLLALVVVWFTYKTAELLFPDDVFIQVLAPALVGLQPMFLFIMAGVNNDALANALFAAVFYLLVLLIKKGFNPNRAMILGLLLGLGIATKGSFILMVPLALFALVAKGIIDKEWRQAARDAAATLVFGVLGLSWLAFWDARVLLIYLTGANTGPGLIDWERFASFQKLGDYFLKKLFVQYWADFGWLSVTMANWVYIALGLFSVLAFVGAIIWSRQARKNKTLEKYTPACLWFLVMSIFAFTVAVLRFDLVSGGGSQGRYLLPCLLPTSVLLAVGWRGLIVDKARRYALPALVFSLTGFCATALFLYVIPHFYLVQK